MITLLGGVAGAATEIFVGGQITSIDKAGKRLQAANDAMAELVPLAHGGAHRCCKHTVRAWNKKSACRKPSQGNLLSWKVPGTHLRAS